MILSYPFLLLPAGCGCHMHNPPIFLKADSLCFGEKAGGLNHYSAGEEDR